MTTVVPTRISIVQCWQNVFPKVSDTVCYCFGTDSEPKRFSKPFSQTGRRSGGNRLEFEVDGIRRITFFLSSPLLLLACDDNAPRWSTDWGTPYALAPGHLHVNCVSEITRPLCPLKVNFIKIPRRMFLYINMQVYWHVIEQLFRRWKLQLSQEQLSLGSFDAGRNVVPGRGVRRPTWNKKYKRRSIFAENEQVCKLWCVPGENG